MNMVRNWLARERERQIDVANGLDADLFHDHRRKFRTSIGLLGIGLLVAWLVNSFHLSGVIAKVIVSAAVISALLGALGLWWAGAEWSFLNRANPKEPQSILKKER